MSRQSDARAPRERRDGGSSGAVGGVRPAPGEADAAATARESGDVRSVSRALALLGLFDAERPRAALSELARDAALPVSTAQRLLQTLERERFLARDGDGLYSLGPAVVRLGLAAVRGLPLHERSGPFLAELSARTGETANLAILDADGRATYIRRVLSPQTIRHESWLGRPFPLARTAVGPALQGRVAADGRHATRRTREPDVSAVAAPVHDARGHVVAALSVTGPTFRIDDAALARCGDAVVDVAREFSLSLGGEWPYRTPSRTRVRRRARGPESTASRRAL